MKKQQGHQGDLQFKESALPKSAKKVNKQPLAYGEKSGHQHIITGDYEMFQDEKSDFYVVAGDTGCTIRHIHESNFKGFDKDADVAIADHNNIKLQPGKTFRFGIHLKYNPFSKVFEKVID